MGRVFYNYMPVTPEASAENLLKLSDYNRGRIVAASVSEDGNFVRLFTGMGGRSAGSKNREYRRVLDLNGNGEYIRTVVHDPALQTGDPSATLYVAQRSWEDDHVAGNGEQVEGIAIALALGDEFRDGQSLYQNEGEKNGYTGRITVAFESVEDVIHVGRILPRTENPAKSEYEARYYRIAHDDSIERDYAIYPGEGVYTVTYDGKGGTAANYEEPWKILLPGSLEDNMDILWNAWKNQDPEKETRANLVGKEIDRGSGRFTYAIRSIHPGAEEAFHSILL
jgi:hypothetical protein